MTDSYGSDNWIGALPAIARQEVERRMFSRSYQDGELLYRAGEPGEELFQVMAGNVRIYTLNEEGRELLYDLFAAGTCFGETSLIDDQPRAHITQAVGPVTVRVLSKTDLLQLWREHPDVSLAVARLLCDRSRKLYGIYEHVSLSALSRRMAGRLCTLARSVGQPQADGVHFDIRITQEDIGCLVAGSRQSVNKILKQWQAEGLIHLAYGALVLTDLPGLERVAASPD